jgi:hypothetical protein
VCLPSSCRPSKPALGNNGEAELCPERPMPVMVDEYPLADKLLNGHRLARSNVAQTAPRGRHAVLTVGGNRGGLPINFFGDREVILSLCSSVASFCGLKSTAPISLFSAPTRGRGHALTTSRGIFLSRRIAPEPKKFGATSRQPLYSRTVLFEIGKCYCPCALSPKSRPRSPPVPQTLRSGPHYY